jgi:hypothetical protein
MMRSKGPLSSKVEGGDWVMGEANAMVLAEMLMCDNVGAPLKTMVGACAMRTVMVRVPPK